MKKLLYFGMGCFILGVFIAIIISLLPVFPLATKGFLMDLQNGSYNQAYSMLTPEFQQKYEFNSFKRDMHDLGLDQYQSVEIVKSEQDPTKKHGYITAIVTTKLKKKITLKLEFVQVQGTDWMDKGWRIDLISVPSS